ncbi:MAG: IclR family transcriptional regulator [Spirochaetales bacterium]|nr:IclR family transcriptional regulator [Spirochaetales bacterium]
MKVQTLDRTFNILELLSKQQKGLSLTDISKSINLHKSTVYRLLSALMSRGYIEKRNSRYRLGLEFVELCSLYINSLELKTEAEPILRELSRLTTQTVFLATMQEQEVIYIDKVEKFNSLRKYSIIGQRRPLYCTSLGKVFLMGMSNDEIKDYLSKKEIISFTQNTIEDMPSLIENINLSRKRGWTFDDEEYETNVQCVGAPIYDYRKNIIAAVSTVWYVDQVKNLNLEEIAGFVVCAAQDISKHLGYRQK